jgi:protein-S-isoprenylcysteine O-methyltransferase Ste14
LLYEGSEVLPGAELEQNIAERPSSVPWPPILLLAVLVASWVLGRALPLAWPGTDDGPARTVGIAIGIAGLLLFVWAAMTLKRHHTTILPDKGADHLVTDGPYRFRRNPIYIAHVMILLSIAELTKNIWFVLLALLYAVLVTWLAVMPEERHLEAKFGDAYRAYKATTRRWI